MAGSATLPNNSTSTMDGNATLAEIPRYDYSEPASVWVTGIPVVILRELEYKLAT